MSINSRVGRLILGTAVALSGVLQAAGTFAQSPSAPVVTTLYNFNTSYTGEYGSGCGLGPDGSLYLNTQGGGYVGQDWYVDGGGFGVVDKISPSGAVTALHTFDGYDGVDTFGIPVVVSPTGTVYGACSWGGSGFAGSFTSGYGNVYTISPNGQFQVIHCFQNGVDGSFPDYIAYGADGNIYGVCESGGANGYGCIFEISDGVFSTVYSFSGQNGTPYAVTEGSGGVFYCTNPTGGVNGAGSVLSVIPSQGESVIYTFTGSEGGVPFAPVTIGADGMLYGNIETQSWLGLPPSGGAIYRICPQNGNFSIVTLFDGPNGYNPGMSLVPGANGQLYGVTEFGGNGFSGPWTGYGTVFSTSTDGSQFNQVYAFSQTDGADPFYPLVFGGDGAIYVSTLLGGTYGYGTAGKIAPNGQFSQLASLGATSGINGTGLVEGSDGGFYGTNYEDQPGDYWPPAGFGNIYQLSKTGAYTVLHEFCGLDGSNPSTNLVQGPDGAYYGAADFGGPGYTGPGTGNGVIFRITQDGAFSVIHNFDGSDGTYPDGSLTVGSNGDLYGVTAYGGANGNGTMFRVSTSGVGFTTLYNFVGPEGTTPYGIIQGSDDGLYTACYYGGQVGVGSIVKITGGGTLAWSHSMQGSSDGSYPNCNLIFGSDGYLYDTAFEGGDESSQYWPAGYGTVFKIEPDGSAFTVVHTFEGVDGGSPFSAPILADDGNYYGITSLGGYDFYDDVYPSGFGVVYQITPDGAYSVISCTIGSDTPLIQGCDGLLYGISQGSNDGFVSYSLCGYAFGINLGLPPVVPPAASITSVSPGTQLVGHGVFTVKIKGSGLNAGSVAYFAGTALPTTDNSPTQVTATIAPALVAVAGSYAIMVVNPGSASSNAIAFTVSNPAPTASSVSPNTQTVGHGKFYVKIDGTAYNSSTVAYFDGTALATTLISSTEVKATIPAALVTTAGYYPVTVINPAPGGGASASVSFSVTNPTPTIAGVSPNSQTSGHGEFYVKIDGTGYNASTVAYFNGTALATTLISPTEVKATIPATLVTGSGAYPITVTNPGPGGGTSNSDTFTVN